METKENIKALFVGNKAVMPSKLQLALCNQFQEGSRKLLHILEQLPGKYRWLLGVMDKLEHGQLLSAYSLTARWSYLKDPWLKDETSRDTLESWNIRPLVLLHWADELLTDLENTPPAPRFYKITDTQHTEIKMLMRWCNNAQKMEAKYGLPIHRLLELKPQLRLLLDQTNESLNLLVDANKRLVYNLANKLGGPEHQEDLLQEGYMGLLRGLERFQYEYNCKLSTYIVYWIRQYMMQYLDKNTTQVKVPTQIRMLQRRISTEAVKQQVPLDAVILPEMENNSLIKQHNLQIARNMVQERSLQDITQYKDSETNPLENVIEEHSARDSIMVATVRMLLEQLSQKERGALMLHFNMVPQTSQDFADIQHMLNASSKDMRNSIKAGLLKMQKMLTHDN